MTFYAVVAAAARQHDAADRALADEAWLPFAAIDAMLELKESFFSIGVDVVGNRGASEFNRLTENFLHGVVQLA